MAHCDPTAPPPTPGLAPPSGGEPPDARAFFDAAARDYEDQHYGPDARSFMSVRLAHVLAIVDALALPAQSVAVDAGCGPGPLSAALAARGLRVLAHDTSPAMLRRARGRAHAVADARAPALQVASVERMPYRDAVADLVCSVGVLEYLPDDARLLGEMRRVLRPGGIAIVAATNLWSPAGSLDFLVEAAKRRPALARVAQRLRPEHRVRARHFAVRRHRPAALRHSLAAAGFDRVRGRYFYLLPWPHPFDRLFPRATARCNRWLEPWSDSPLGWLAEGYLAVARRPVA